MENRDNFVARSDSSASITSQDLEECVQNNKTMRYKKLLRNLVKKNSELILNLLMQKSNSKNLKQIASVSQVTVQ